MLWNSSQQGIINNFIEQIKTIEWFRFSGNPSEKYWVVDTIWEACDIHGQQTQKVWGINSEHLEKKALSKLSEQQIDNVFEQVSLAIGNEVYDALCDLEDRIGQETDEDQSGIEDEILDFIKRDTAWACIELLLDDQGFFTQVYEINRSGRWVCSWIGKYPRGNFIIM